MKIKQVGIVFLLMLSFSAAWADPFSVSFTGVQTGSTGAPYVDGQTMTITIILDNGSATSASQTWAGADVVSVNLSVNSGAITTIFEPNTLPGDGIDFTLGSFTTDAGGILTSVPSNWSDGNITANTNVTSTNDPTAPLLWQVIDGVAVAYGVGITPFIVTSPPIWSNPVAIIAPAAASAESAPTLSEWVLILLAFMLGGVGYQAAGKAHK